LAISLTSAFFLIVVNITCAAQTASFGENGNAELKSLDVGDGSVGSKEPLERLIDRLRDNGQLKKRSKADEIGYTEDMYAIAAYKNTAIGPLLDALRKTTDVHTQVGVVYTLYLIGIDGHETRRGIEKFTSDGARAAMLSLVDNADYGDLVVMLLARDPWPSDLPVLVETLRRDLNPRAAIITALFRYVPSGGPFRQKIDSSRDSIEVDGENLNGRFLLGHLTTLIRETEKDDPGIANALLNEQDVVVQFAEWNGRPLRVVRRFLAEGTAEKLHKSFGERTPAEILDKIFRLSITKVENSSFSGAWEDSWDYVEDGRIIVIVDPDVARKRWIKYFREG
jgi:hypothetical protein